MYSLFPGFDARPRQFFIDMNAFFTSVEQQECAQYRGKPTIVAPVLADTTCALAASYEAKALGIKTGTSVKLARITCPGLQIVEARPELYMAYHTRLVEILNAHFTVVKALSVDEMTSPLSLRCRTVQQEEQKAQQVKAQILQELGPWMRSSVGIGPNVFLAKVAAERRKPDGLTIWNEENLPDALFALPLRALPGIGSALKRRLETHGITTVEELWEASPQDLRRAWGSVVGERWWYMLRGSQEVDYQPMRPEGQGRKSVSHSHVLGPENQTLEGAKTILLELFAKALKRLRAYQQAASAVSLTVQYRKCREATGFSVPFTGKTGEWVRSSRKHLHANDDLTWLRVVRPLLESIPDLSPNARPGYVGITFSGLLACQDMNLSLFEEAEDQQRLARIVDALNGKHEGAVTLASLSAKRQIPYRIPFGTPQPPV